MFSMEFIDKGRGVLFTGAGELTGDEMMAPKYRMLEDPAKLTPLRFAIVSLIDVTRFDISPEQVHALAELDKQIGQHAPVVVVVVIAPRTHDFGMARMWETILDVPGWTSSVVRTRVEADAFLASHVTGSETERSGA
jgi:hypothetical protein